METGASPGTRLDVFGHRYSVSGNHRPQSSKLDHVWVEGHIQGGTMAMERMQNGRDTVKPAQESETRKLYFEPLDKNSFTPMYFQIQSHLLKMIQSGELRAGDSVPSEEELARVYGVSRMTSRQALQSLKSQGYAAGQKGRGTFVTQPKVEKDIAHLAG